MLPVSYGSSSQNPFEQLIEPLPNSFAHVGCSNLRRRDQAASHILTHCLQNEIFLYRGVFDQVEDGPLLLLSCL